MASAGGWLSVHLSFDGDLYGVAADRVILELAAPVAAECRRRGWANRYFFVRYNVGGPHLRLRLLGRRRGLARPLRALVAARADALGGLVREVAWVPYEPELDRYGGPAGVAVAERFFDASSRTAVALLRKLPPGDRASRLGKGLLATLVLLHAFARDREAAGELARGYGEGYLRVLTTDADHHRRLTEAFASGLRRQADALSVYVEAAWEALEEGDGLPVEMARYRRHVVAARERLQKLFAVGRAPEEAATETILPSYLHMNNNRLGVNVQEEAYLATVASRTLAGRTDAVAAGGRR
jgi:thiopeptide-type bacteriocin biosynthesis protein